MKKEVEMSMKEKEQELFEQVEHFLGKVDINDDDRWQYYEKAAHLLKGMSNTIPHWGPIPDYGSQVLIEDILKQESWYEPDGSSYFATKDRVDNNAYADWSFYGLKKALLEEGYTHIMVFHK